MATEVKTSTSKITTEKLASLGNNLIKSSKSAPKNSAIDLASTTSDTSSEYSSDSDSNSEDFMATQIPHPPWWTVVKIGPYKVKALIDNGASRTCFGPIGLQLATAVGAKVKPYNGPPIRDARGKALSVGVQVRQARDHPTRV